ncbi:dynein heavy chain [Ancylostoma duodenale]|uniref:Dynein heavy chain n=1 Tax=Ancylostoma duodenale TaxID=51022 RepID=A0A0C2H441_9BILA|nr:dynein heavy chain [Ancylostoma duodenale]
MICSSASAILQCLSQHCVQTSSASGRVLRPKDRAQLILYLKSLNLPAPDKITASMAPSTTHSSIPPRLVSQMRMLAIGYPSEQNLNAIYCAYLMPILEPPLGSSTRVEAMASAMVRLYEEIRSNFRPADRGHYIFTPRDLTKWTLGIMRHELSDDQRYPMLLVLMCVNAIPIGYDFIRRAPSKTARTINLLQVIQSAISNSEHVVLLIEDYEILRSSFLEAINCLISSGEVPGLLAPQGAEDQKTSMEKLRTATEEENAKIAEKKKKIDEQLKDVEPLLKEARSAVGSIKSESLSEIRSLRAPPEAIRDILQAVLLFMGILDTSWEAMRKFLSKSSVKDEIINFDAHRITRDVHKKVSALVKSKEASFDPKNAKRASVAAAPLAAWVTANLQYSEILEKISPLEQEKNELVSNLSKAEKQIQKLSKGLLTVDEKVAALKEKFEMLMKEATQIKIDLEKEQDTIKVAGTLIDRLGGEFTRWQAQMESLSKEMDNVERCALVTATFVTYLGGCSEHTRTEVLKSFRQNYNLQDFSPVTFCATETEQLNWKNHGLPADSLSIENTVIMLNSTQTPMVIDPTGRVAAFLHSFHPKAELLRATQNDLFTQIEFGIRFGKTIIVDDVTEVDAVLVPIFRKELSSQGPRQVISFADKQIDFHPDFKLFLCTKNQHIVIPSSIRNVLSEVNFTTTRSGLTSQLLGLAIQIEKPELEERSSALARDAEGKKMELEKLEQLLLQQLASSEENLLGNTVLLDSLNKSKQNAETISRGIEESEKLRKELNDVKRIPKPNTGTYRCFQDNTSSRIDTQMRSLQLAVFYYISRALFKVDRLMFALSFVHGTLPKMFLPKEWELFTGFILDEQQVSPVAIPWVDESRYSAVAKLQAHLPTLYNNLQFSDQGTWNEFSRAVDCENTIPSAIETKITPFQKVLLIQAVRPDRLYAAMQNFVLKTLSLPSINPPPFDLADILAESSNQEPILLILAGGADPSQELEELAAKTIGYHNYVSISMGQGQEQATIDGIRKATKEGQWICLYNVHLMLSIIPTIQKELAAATPHERFRLWMTTEEESKFPAMMLQRSLKVTFEPPPGIRNNLLRTYSQIDDARRSVLTTQATFVLAWLHALLQERRTFIPQMFHFTKIKFSSRHGNLEARFQVQKVHACLSLISKSIRGTVTPDKSTLEVIKSLQLHQVGLRNRLTLF